MSTVTSINGSLYLAMLRGGAAVLNGNRDAVNSLNVFPVPDGDTGTNMSMTISSVNAIEDAPLADAATAAAKAMMRAARGNSGVILSLFFRGVARALASANVEDADTKLLLTAFREGAKSAAAAVANPVEGTILTVMRECCSAEYDTTDAGVLFDIFYDDAERILAKTPEMLPVLRRAKVVDSGGYGFVRILDGMRRVLHGEVIDADAVAANEQTKQNAPAKVNVNASADFTEFTDEDITFGWETLSLMDRDPAVTDEQIEALRTYFDSVGDSVVMTYDEEIFKLHIHSDVPVEILEKTAFIGVLRDARIENLRLQHQELSEAEVGHANVEPEPEPRKPYGLFAVASGDGMSDLFHELGADAVISGGQSMNPSAEDIMRAINSAPCEVAFVLPNNKNIILAAKQAADILEDTRVIVIESTTVPQGVSAMMTFNSSRTPEENADYMSQAMSSVTTLSVTRAVRDADIDGLAVKRRQYIGLVNGQLKFAADSVSDCIHDMIASFPDTELCTVYFGSDAKNAETEAVVSMIEETLGSDCEVVSVRGDQPVYPYIISLE